jgi:hypothetical protein
VALPKVETEIKSILSRFPASYLDAKLVDWP